ncbi:MAG: hypothetical protein HYZ50_05780 [Deltaproteobacteria bacterium]|nr:hypothetical protein [Deltaproteobacteria bacterium]
MLKNDNHASQEHVSLTQGEWRRLWEREYTVLLKVAMMLLNDAEDAREVVHTAFIDFDKKVTQSGRTIELRGQPFDRAMRSYLVGIVRNHALTTWRRRKREKLSQVEEATGIHSKPLSPEEEKMLTEGVSDETKEQIERLPPKLKAFCLFLLKHLDEEASQHWSLWAKENGLDPTNQRLRNTFDKLKERLRKEFRSINIGESIGEKR